MTNSLGNLKILNLIKQVNPYAPGSNYNQIKHKALEKLAEVKPELKPELEYLKKLAGYFGVDYYSTQYVFLAKVTSGTYDSIYGPRGVISNGKFCVQWGAIYYPIKPDDLGLAGSDSKYGLKQDPVTGYFSITPRVEWDEDDDFSLPVFAIKDKVADTEELLKILKGEESYNGKVIVSDPFLLAFSKLPPNSSLLCTSYTIKKRPQGKNEVSIDVCDEKGYKLGSFNAKGNILDYIVLNKPSVSENSPLHFSTLELETKSYLGKSYLSLRNKVEIKDLGNLGDIFTP